MSTTQPGQRMDRKDKRVLVLFLLGILILLLSIELPSFRERPGKGWVYRYENSRLIGIPAHQTLDLGVWGAETWRLEEAWGKTTAHSKTPRQCFFLHSPFNINDAGARELMLLPGIGPSLAAKIIAYRQKHGPFSSPKELLSVTGIGPKTLQRILDGCPLTTQ
ncbi:MAG: hypothetical protein CSA33_04000 [Desulfobulbus propionicus]|nr:MAG: hypothetical protein CSA33_04000 [Desulfobulbus propionicus]